VYLSFGYFLLAFTTIAGQLADAIARLPLPAKPLP